MTTIHRPVIRSYITSVLIGHRLCVVPVTVKSRRAA